MAGHAYAETGLFEWMLAQRNHCYPSIVRATIPPCIFYLEVGYVRLTP